MPQRFTLLQRSVPVLYRKSAGGPTSKVTFFAKARFSLPPPCTLLLPSLVLERGSHRCGTCCSARSPGPRHCDGAAPQDGPADLPSELHTWAAAVSGLGPLSWRTEGARILVAAHMPQSLTSCPTGETPPLDRDSRVIGPAACSSACCDSTPRATAASRRLGELGAEGEATPDRSAASDAPRLVIASFSSACSRNICFDLAAIRCSAAIRSALF